MGNVPTRCQEYYQVPARFQSFIFLRELPNSLYIRGVCLIVPKNHWIHFGKGLKFSHEFLWRP